MHYSRPSIHIARSLPKGKWCAQSFNWASKNVSPTDIVLPLPYVKYAESMSDSDDVLIYSGSLNLLSLRELAPEPKKRSAPVIDMVQTKEGQALKALSLKHPIKICQYKWTKVNNAQLAPNMYTLVYGAVPTLMAAEYVTYVLKKKAAHKKSNAKLQEGEPASSGAVRQEMAPQNGKLREGELEIGAYCYTLLASLDLVSWRDDLNRSTLKSLLMHACGLIPQKDLRLRVAAYIRMREPKRISAESMLLLKNDFAQIISSLKVAKKADAVTLWMSFMQKAALHHFLCPHTMTEVGKSSKFVARKLIAKQQDLELEDSDYDLTGAKFTIDEAKTFFSFMPHIETATGASMKDVQKTLSTIYNHCAKMFADHLVDYGIYPGMNKITCDHVDGFRKAHGKLLSHNNSEINVPIFRAKFGSLGACIAMAVQKRSPNFDIIRRPAKLDETTMGALCYVINMIILKRVECLLHMDNRDICLVSDNIPVNQSQCMRMWFQC